MAVASRNKLCKQEQRVVEAEVVVQTPSGLHARPAALLYQTVRRFQSRFTITNLDKPRSAELAITPVNLLLADVNQGQRIRLRADGPDEQAALAAVQDLIEANFGE